MRYAAVFVDPRTELLRSISFFSGLSSEDLTALAGTLSPRAFGKDEPVFKQGDLGSSMFLIEDGSVDLSLAIDGNRRITLKTSGRGGAFGELSLFDDKPRSADAVCTEATRLLELQRETLATFLVTRPAAALAIVRALAERLRDTNALLSARAAKNVDEELDRNSGWRDRVADRVAELNGSWAFIGILVGLTGLWCLLNTSLVFPKPLDPYPYQFFNLALAILVGLQGPLIVMSQNRQAMKDRARAETGFKVNLKNEMNIETILRELADLRAETRRGASMSRRDEGADQRPRPSAPT